MLTDLLYSPRQLAVLVGLLGVVGLTFGVALVLYAVKRSWDAVRQQDQGTR